jgi:hypothetical protein
MASLKNPIHGRTKLQSVEYEGASKPAFYLTYSEVKLLGIAGVCVLLSYDLLNSLTVCAKVGFFLDGTLLWSSQTPIDISRDSLRPLRD